jgi:hypothetical protein
MPLGGGQDHIKKAGGECQGRPLGIATRGDARFRILKGGAIVAKPGSGPE